MSDKWEIGGDVALQRFVLDKFGSLLRLVSKVVTASSSSSKFEESILLKIGDRCNILGCYEGTNEGIIQNRPTTC